MVNDADALAKRLRLLEIMRGVKNRRAGRAEAADEFENVQPRLRINAHRRLIQQQQLRAMQQRAAEVDAPLHAAGIGLYRVLRAVRQRERFEQFRGARPGLARTQARHAPPEFQVLPPGQFLINRQFLRHHAHDAFGLLGIGPERLAAHEDFAGVRLEQAGNHRNGGRLARAVGAEQAVNFAGPHLEADGIHGANRAKVLDRRSTFSKLMRAMLSQRQDVASCVWQKMATDFVSRTTTAIKKAPEPDLAAFGRVVSPGRTPDARRAVPALNGFRLHLPDVLSSGASRRAGDRVTGTRKGLDKTKVKPNQRRIFAKPVCPPLTIGLISGRMI